MLRLLPILLLLTACSPKPTDDSTMKPTRTISEVLSAHTTEWLQIPGVIGTGETKKEDKPAIMIMVDHLDDSLRAKLLKEVDGYQVVIDETGKISPLN